MTYEVSGIRRKINFGATGVDEVLQNVSIILSTPKMSVPLRRDWFIDYSLLDAPMPIAQARLSAEIFRAIRDHEPRARIVGPVRYIQDQTQTMEGMLIPSVTIEVTL